MIRVQFYHINTSDFVEVLRFSVGLLSSLSETKHTVQVLLAGEQQATALSAALWNAPDRFLAHDYGSMSHSKISLCFVHTPIEAEILLNLSNRFPPLDPKVHRVVELVWEEGLHKTEARKRYSTYQQQGHTPQYLRIDDTSWKKHTNHTT